MADLLKEKNFFLTLFLKMNQGVFVSREVQDLGFIRKCERILNKGGVVQIFPEARIANDDEERPLPFTPSFVYMALKCNAPIIPLYSSGNYFKIKERTKTAIGKPIYASELYDKSKSRRLQQRKPPTSVAKSDILWESRSVSEGRKTGTSI